jgi:7,8-dihydropterin-6-yl-methyl-4-(beta-D-ribofuranosyl)aminobenzene 5'-phosphate synthase
LKYVVTILLTIIVISLSACNPLKGMPAEIASPTLSLSQNALSTPPTPQAVSTALSPVGTSLTTTQKNSRPSQVATLIATETPVEKEGDPFQISQTLTITIVYDNHATDKRLGTAWGFSALIEASNHILLFDTGGDGQLLMQNMQLLGINPAKIDSVVLSHAHEDHTGGLMALLEAGAKPQVYLLPSFPVSFKHQVEQYTNFIEVLPGQQLAKGIWTTGEISEIIPEQALVIQSTQGLVVITGCAHPGIISILEKVYDLFHCSVHLVLGGFHLGEKSEAEINSIITNFRHLGVGKVAPCHCTGEYAIQKFKEEYGDDLIQAGVGTILHLESSGSR